jgi:hypothetical protein
MDREEAAYVVRTALIRTPHLRYARVYQRTWEVVREHQLETLLDCAHGWAVRMWGPAPMAIRGNELEVLEWALELGREEIVLQIAEHADPKMVEMLCRYNRLEALRIALASFELDWLIVRCALTGDQLRLMHAYRSVSRQGTALYMQVRIELIPTLFEMIPPTAQLVRYARANHPPVAAAILAIAPELAFLNPVKYYFTDVLLYSAAIRKWLGGTF